MAIPQKKKKTLILIVSGVIILSLLVVGDFMIGRASMKNNLPEKKEPAPNQPRDNPPPPNNPPHKPNSPTNPNELQIKVHYYVSLGRNHMWIDYDTKSDKIILIDKENSIFPNSELTKKKHNYTITFSAQDAEKYPNTHDQVYYFSKNNNKFTLKPEQKSPKKPKTEMKFVYVGECDKNEVAFNNLHEKNMKKEDIRIFYISKNHPKIKELLKEGKLQAGKKKQFIIRYGKVDDISKGNLMYTFNEFNQELEITET